MKSSSPIIKNHKFKRLLVTLLFLTATAGLFASEDFLSFSAGLSTGIPAYGSSEIKETRESIKQDGRIIIGTFGHINLNVIEQISFYTGADLLTDWTWKSDHHANFLHLSFPLGFKVYPGLGGLGIGLAYTLGFRADFLATEVISDKKVDCWGNGFKFMLEYNFAHQFDSKYLPTIGVGWNFMPRGNKTYDNLIDFYIAANF